jgi:hypothetical protein
LGLPMVLAVLALFGTFQLVVRRLEMPWPWYLVSFSHGFNIISRVMLLLPNAVSTAGNVNAGYILLTLIALAGSLAFLWYTELPDVRVGLLRQP